MTSGNITKSGNFGNVEGQAFVGGILGVGRAEGSLQFCNSIGDIKAKVTSDGNGSWCGGICGQWYVPSAKGMLSDCYHVGKVSGTGRVVGGIVGTLGSGTSVKSNMERCYFSGTVSGAGYIRRGNRRCRVW